MSEVALTVARFAVVLCYGVFLGAFGSSFIGC